MQWTSLGASFILFCPYSRVFQIRINRNLSISIAAQQACHSGRGTAPDHFSCTFNFRIKLPFDPLKSASHSVYTTAASKSDVALNFERTIESNLMSNELSLKVVVIGDSSVGKTCVSLRYLTGEFSSQTRPTIAAGFCNAKVKLGKTEIDLLIWDTAGQEAYRGLTSQYYRDAKIALIVFDLTNPSTLTSVTDWHARLCDANQGSVVVVLVGNKSDLPNRQVTQEQGEAVAQEIKALYRETSAVTGKGINEVFEDACEEYIRVNGASVGTKRKGDVDLSANGGHKRDGCC